MDYRVRDIYTTYSRTHSIDKVLDTYKYSIIGWSSYIKQAEYEGDNGEWYKTMVIFYTDLFDFVSKYKTENRDG